MMRSQTSRQFVRSLSMFLALTVTYLAGCGAIQPRNSVSNDQHTPAPAVIRYNAIHHPVVASHGMVVSQNVLATHVGRDILAQGGNAVDAAVAVGFALSVTLPRAGNLGGSGFMLVHLAETNETIALDYRSVAPAAFPMENSGNSENKIDWERITFGPMAPAIPGTVAGLHEAWSRFGSLSWEALVNPAIELASKGIIVTNDLAFALAEAQPILSRYPGSAASYLRQNGTAYQAGERILQTDLAWSLRQIRDGGASAFYTGQIAERIVSNLATDGGVITRKDFANYRVRQREPVLGDYRGHRVIAAPLVSSGGITLVQMLNVLEHFNLTELKAGSAASLHLIAEAMKRSAANRRVGIGDPDFVHVPIDGYVSEALARDLATQISPYTATSVSSISASDVGRYESSETTHFSIMDQYGNAVSNTYTLGYSFGSGYVAPGTGILLDNQVRNFTFGQGNHANAIAPGKRMVSTMTPAIVLDEAGDVLLVTGTPGGGRIINVVLQIILNVVDYGMNIAEATHAPRIHQQWRTPTLGVEQGIGVDTMALLKQRGHQIESQQTMGSTQSIVARESLFFGSADPRRPGALAMGVNEAELQARD